MAVADNESALCIQQLVAYACKRGLIQTEDLTWCYNALLDMLSYEGPAPVKPWEKIDLESFDLDQTLAELARLAVAHGLAENTQSGEDSFAMRIMGLLLPKPSEVAHHFNELYASEGPRAATDWFYTLCCDAGYVRRSAIARNITWTTPTTWGDLEITINLSKPEKDPREIAAAKTAQNTSGEKYPACQLCLDNEGYSGRGASSGAGAHPARQNLRIIPIELNQHRWGFQYSPYAYFNEHCIAMNSDHIPMHIDHEALVNLFDFVDRFPHYFIGSNADLPIVGGSILSHDHFQGGRHVFPMEKATIKERVSFKGFEDVETGIVNWPMSVLRLRGDKDRLITLADVILQSWINYSDESLGIYSHTEGVRHNTVNPVARFKNGKYELDLALRNNRTDTEHPMGIFHPYEHLHNIKKENIGIIEVMGLAILPGRLKTEMASIKTLLSEAITAGNAFSTVYTKMNADSALQKHTQWLERYVSSCPTPLSIENLDNFINRSIGDTFCEVLENCGVFKHTPKGEEGFRRFVAQAQV